VPDPLFNLLLEQIDDLAELKVTLRAFWLEHQKKGAVRSVSKEEFFNDRVLLQALKSAGQSPQAAIQRGLELAVKRQTLLAYLPNTTRLDHKVYLVNTESNRRALQQLQGKSSVPEESYSDSESDVESPTDEKPNIFSLYESKFGRTFSPNEGEEMKDAEETYPWEWINEAFNVAFLRNKLSWDYVEAILRRRTSEGKDHGESGRHSEENNRTKYLEEYQRRRGHLPWEPADR
jgi:DnaD/phage-associated family protein